MVFSGAEEDLDALELSGNRLVNQCYEASATSKEKDGRHKRKYGLEAFFFEKFVNRAYFDELLYRQLITESSKALVEKRVNQQLRGFNVKKMSRGSSRSLSVESDDESNPGSSEAGSRKSSRERRDRPVRERKHSDQKQKQKHTKTKKATWAQET